ncbi:hypothetical protein C7441_13212 [Pseudaminobacter salicylatoxidans]|uniref:Uncharacterized protein n=1 Tax=Pseudaminobacter salicylatoxidans TaxID=93369 RepID=A0A316BN97_PSESE|nr:MULTISPECIES: hypothetical protein [Hyphomicrobiales]PWJ72655.1 hypothetical protein C7441_13212 [Pseudaminobacter salicylatoxidans]
MTQDARKSTKALQSEREALLDAMPVDASELTFTPRGDPDPRLVRLARLLGEQLARENFLSQMDGRPSRDSR